MPIAILDKKTLWTKILFEINPDFECIGKFLYKQIHAEKILLLSHDCNNGKIVIAMSLQEIQQQG